MVEVLRRTAGMIECKLHSSKRQTAFGPLCALGHYLIQERVLEPLCGVEIAQKTVEHSPTQKLMDALIGILSGCEALYQTNCRLRPDLPLQRAFGRERCAEQSTIQRTLNAFTPENVSQLREAVEAIHRRNSPIFSHPFEREMLLLEVDLTGLRASKKAEGSTKGYFSGERNATGRQLLRVIAPQYGELIFEKLYAGNTNSCEVLKEALGEAERILGLEKGKRGRTLVRVDGGFGTDENLNWLIWRGYEFMAKGYGGRRANKLAESVPEGSWREGPTEGQLLGVPEAPHRYARETESVVRHWSDRKGKLYTDYLVTTLLGLGPCQIAKLYDGRAGVESDIKGDKRGLGIEERRKKGFFAQEALALLAQLAHNLIAWFKRWFLGGTPAAKLGVERMVRDVLAMPAEVRVGRFSGVLRLRLPRLHPWAKAVAAGTEACSLRNGRRTIWRKN
jgi:Transposase DDE domain group 1